MQYPFKQALKNESHSRLIGVNEDFKVGGHYLKAGETFMLELLS